MHDDMDDILGTEPAIIVSDRFTADVMRAVREEAVAPPPIPFPWRRLVFGTAAAGLVAVLTVVLPQLDAGGLLVSLQQTQQSALNSDAFWFAAGGLVSYVSVKLSFLSTA